MLTILVLSTLAFLLYDRLVVRTHRQYLKHLAADFGTEAISDWARAMIFFISQYQGASIMIGIRFAQLLRPPRLMLKLAADIDSKFIICPRGLLTRIMEGLGLIRGLPIGVPSLATDFIVQSSAPELTRLAFGHPARLSATNKLISSGFNRLESDGKVLIAMKNYLKINDHDHDSLGSFLRRSRGLTGVMADELNASSLKSYLDLMIEIASK